MALFYCRRLEELDLTELREELYAHQTLKMEQAQVEAIKKELKTGEDKRAQDLKVLSFFDKYK